MQAVYTSQNQYLGFPSTQYSGFSSYRYVHVLIQKMAVNADLGFILALVDFFSIDTDPLMEVSNYRGPF